MLIRHLLAVQADPVGAYAMTTGRLWSLIAAGLGLAGAAVGALALARSTGRLLPRPRTATGAGIAPGAGTGRRGAVVALAAGLTCMVIGGVVVAAAKGGPGTGYGIVGGYLDLALGLAAMILGALTLARHRRTG
ncbi:DUF6223 family protein [Nonomuraea sp. NPDC047529]|uniref:DUF6223 family protein n=1 Tax=Nonomuraea sp. NPDC047529 TaxID=3155623 RepID=UPI0033E55B35